MPYALRPTTPSLNERFILPPDLRTDAVFIADDDMLYDMSEVDLAFRTWKTQPMSPVGFFARMHYWDDDLGLYVDSKDQYSSAHSDCRCRLYCADVHKSHPDQGDVYTCKTVNGLNLLKWLLQMLTPQSSLYSYTCDL